MWESTHNLEKYTLYFKVCQKRIKENKIPFQAVLLEKLSQTILVCEVVDKLQGKACEKSEVPCNKYICY